MFAPLLDRMTTRDISRRFTATQALEFLESFTSELTQEQLQDPAPPEKLFEHTYENYDRWTGLPDTFIKEWGHFREPRLTFQIRLLRRICDHDWGYKVVQWIRHIIRFSKKGFHFYTSALCRFGGRLPKIISPN
jgi:hypothetical protein